MSERETTVTGLPRVDPERAEEAYGVLQSRYGAMEGLPSQRPTFPVRAAARRVLARLEALEGVREAVLGRLSAEAGEAYVEALELLPQAARGAWFVATCDARWQAVDSSGDPALKRLVEEAYALRDLGLKVLTVLELVKLVSPEHADHIRAGRGHLDCARDLIALAELCERHRDVLAPLEASKPEGEPRLDASARERMAAIGPRLVEHLSQRSQQRAPEGQPDWRRELIAAARTLQDAWDAARWPTIMTLQLDGRAGQAEALAGLDALTHDTGRV